MDDYAPAYKAWVAALDTMNKTIRVSTAGISYDEVDRRLRMTTLLMHLDFDMSEDAPKQEAWQKRVALVVGLPDYLAAIKHRTARLNANGGYLASIKNQRDQLEARFVEMYQYQLMVASYRDYLLEAQQKITKGLQEQAVKEVSLTAQRTTQRNVARADMDKIVAAVNAAVAEQSRIESDLFTIQKQVGQVLRENFELEDRIQAAEKVLQGIR